MASDPDEGNELSMLFDDDGRVCSDSRQDVCKGDCTIRIFQFLMLG